MNVFFFIFRRILFFQSLMSEEVQLSQILRSLSCMFYARVSSSVILEFLVVWNLNSSC